MNDEKDILLSYCNLIIKNVENNGWKRYDPIDLKSQNFMQKNMYVRNIFLVAEMFVPILLRKLFRIKKSIHPTSYYFISAAYLIFEQRGIQTINHETSSEIMEKCIEKYVISEEEEVWWSYTENRTFYPDKERSNKRPTLPLYSIARCNQLLMKLGKVYNRKDFLLTAEKSLQKTVEHHKIYDVGNQQKSICYYYNSKESTINVNTEMIEWLAMSGEQEKYSELTQEILNMVLDNQNADGSWYYFSKWHKEYVADTWGDIDMHHTATVLYNLIHYAELQPKRSSKELICSIDKGMQFFLDNLFNLRTGAGKVLIGKRREAGSVQYAEAVIAFVDYVKSAISFDEKIRENVKKILPKVVSQMLKLIRTSDGAAASDKIIRRIYLDSIRWGNGPVLYAIAKYIEYCQEIGTW